MSPGDPLVSSNAERLKPGDLVDEREAAAILGLCVQTLRNWRWRNEGPRVRKVGLRLVRYHRADLAAFIETKVGA
ncbi:helix-turn-helix domain-containing protein [Dokdonella sp.]|jgi:predicted DNA-binding transcriptional regulator AlpA|uniref:helix-turn-helix transcriptional regulator n=1 Tax=Dokdonella sp. TaxID=2291710 RepID=UPI002DD698A5|nr:helix-turn-helix domain-containing protein [Dokdonella sp.]